MAAHRRAVLGLVYLLTMAALVGTSIQAYRKALPWQRWAEVVLTTRQTGLELNPHSDVEFQGARVGEVRRITSDGLHATVLMALDRRLIATIPAGVDAVIVPKTLFGEKYVDLRRRSSWGAEPVAASAAGGHIEDGDRIEQSATAVELGTIFDRLVPILRRLDPAKLSSVLGSLAAAVDGRGEDIADALRTTRQLLRGLDPSLGTLVHDLRRLSTTADVYADAAPDMLGILDDLGAISRENLVPHEQTLAALLDTVTGTATKTERVLARNRLNLVRLSGRARPVLRLLDTYSQTLPCILTALHKGDRLANLAAGVRGPYIALTIDMMVDKPAYTYPKDLPDNPRSDANVHVLPPEVPGWAPHCPRLPARLETLKDAPPYSEQPYAQAVPPGSEADRSGGGGPGGSSRPQALPDTVLRAREALARALVAQRMGMRVTDVPGYATLLALPLVADGEVEVR